nr:MAG TPA: hypothetical protein [Caudoviricetes sp.]
MAACSRLPASFQSPSSESEDTGDPRWGWGDRLIPISHRVPGVSEPDRLDRIHCDE